MDKKLFKVIACWVLALSCNHSIANQIIPAANEREFLFCSADNAPKYEVAFSPKQGATELVISAINKAKKQIYVAAYSFTSQSIADALIKAHKRGVEVKLILDKSGSNDRSCKLKCLKSEHIPIRISNKDKMHNKFMVIDAEKVQLGSFNYSKSAEDKNAENVLVINNCPQLASLYMRAWQDLWDKGK